MGGNAKCTHLTIDDHKRDGAWICSVCKKSFVWGKESAWYGRIECKKCRRDLIQEVLCSKQCRTTPDERALQGTAGHLAADFERHQSSPDADRGTGFEPSKAYIRYVAYLLMIMDETENGRGGSAKATRLAVEADPYWYKMSDRERKLVNRLSAAIQDMKKGDSSGH